MVEENSDVMVEMESDTAFVDIPVEEPTDAGLPAHRELSQEEMEFHRGFIESILFVSTEPLTLGMLSRKANLDRVNTRILVDSLMDDYSERDGGIQLREISGGFQFLTSERYAQMLSAVFREQKREKLSRSTLETLAIISYKQPITLPEIEELRGANSRAMVTTLLSKKLVKPQGYKPVPGRPTLYVTTRNFLKHFSLNSIADLPPLEEVKELKFDDLD